MMTKQKYLMKKIATIENKTLQFLKLEPFVKKKFYFSFQSPKMGVGQFPEVLQYRADPWPGSSKLATPGLEAKNQANIFAPMWERCRY